MKIPPHYLVKEWTRFFSGMAMGGLISWIIFLYIHGEWNEEFSKTMKLQEERIQQLEKEKKIWQEDIEEINKKNQEKLTVQNIEVKIINYQKYKLDTFSVHEMEEKVKESIRSLISKDIETAFESDELVRRAIENQTYIAHDKRYRLTIYKIVYYTTITIHLQLQLEQ